MLSDINKDSPRVQVYGELLKNPKYRIYVGLEDEQLLTKLFNMLREHKCIYTPYFGNSTCICDFRLAYDEIFNAEHQVRKLHQGGASHHGTLDEILHSGDRPARFAAGNP